MPPYESKPLDTSKTKGVEPMPLPPAEPPAPRIAIGEVSKDLQNDFLRGLCERLSPTYATDAADNIVYANTAFADIARALFDVPADIQAIDETPAALMRIVEKLYLARRSIESMKPLLSAASAVPSSAAISQFKSPASTSSASAAASPMSRRSIRRRGAPARWRAGCRTSCARPPIGFGRPTITSASSPPASPRPRASCRNP